MKTVQQIMEERGAPLHGIEWENEPGQLVGQLSMEEISL